MKIQNFLFVVLSLCWRQKPFSYLCYVLHFNSSTILYVLRLRLPLLVFLVASASFLRYGRRRHHEPSTLQLLCLSCRWSLSSSRQKSGYILAGRLDSMFRVRSTRPAHTIPYPPGSRTPSLRPLSPRYTFPHHRSLRYHIHSTILISLPQEGVGRQLHFLPLQQWRHHLLQLLLRSR